MWTEVPVYKEDMEQIISDRNIPWDKLDGKTILVTGATGLIGSNVVNAILYYGDTVKNPPHVLAFVRNREKAGRVFSKQIKEYAERLSFVIGDITEKISYEEDVNYIIHAASETASARFIETPVETILTAVEGTRNVLDFARDKHVASLVYLSSMEAYGSPTEEMNLTEDAPAYFSSSAVRSCYPESKRMCEALSVAYMSEYGLPAKCIRLAQTFGPGIAPDDKRVFADFTRKALRGEDIIIATTGKSKRMYLYTADAVRAILTVLLKGKDGMCYNAANEESYCSIVEMARLVSSIFSEGRTSVRFSSDLQDREKYPKDHKLKLDVSRLKALGWKASVDLPQMFRRMQQGEEEQNK